jgi:hypothetical protein
MCRAEDKESFAYSNSNHTQPHYLASALIYPINSTVQNHTGQSDHIIIIDSDNIEVRNKLRILYLFSGCSFLTGIIIYIISKGGYLTF